jgi:acetolactate synthase-1/2/3 large subunit
MKNADAARRLPPHPTTSDSIIEILKIEGLEFLSAYPTTPLIESAAKASLPPVLCRQERVGVGIADGYTRVTGGRPAAAFAMQWGPGVENAYPGIATAYADNVPMLLLPSGYEQDRIDAPRTFSGRRLSPITKSVERIRRPDDVADVMRRAFSQLRSGRPGPVAVELPHDIALERLQEPLVYEPVTTFTTAADPQAVEQAVKLLLAAERPVILAGQGVLYAQASSALVQLSELLDAPVVTTIGGKSAFPEDHALSLGAASITMSPMARDFVAEADLILAVGASLTKHFMSLEVPSQVNLIHVTVDEADLNKDTIATVPVLGDALSALTLMVSALSEGRPVAEATTPTTPLVRRGTAQRIATMRRQWLTAWQPLLTSNESPISHYRVVSELNNALSSRRSIVTHDSGSPRDQLSPFYVARRPRSYIGWGKSHALGSGLGLMIGAKIADPAAICVHVMGDAAFGMVGLDFETAVRNRIPILAIVLNNSTMAIETPTMEVAQDRYGSRDIGGQYARLAQAMGGWSERVTDPRALEDALARAIKANLDGEAALLEIITSPHMTPFSCRVGQREISDPTGVVTAPLGV